MLLLSKQWSRIGGAGVLLLLLLYYLNSIHAIGPLSRGIDASLEATENAHTQAQPYRPQDEVQGVPSVTKLEYEEAATPVEPTTAAANSEDEVKDDALLLTGTQGPEALSSAVATRTSISSTLSSDQASTTTTQETTSTGLRKAIVMGKLSEEDTTWVDELSDWENNVYVVDLAINATSPTGHKTKVNKAKEATPYLTYIVEHYDDFPDAAVFVHAHRDGWPQAWHNDAPGYDAVKMIKMLQIPTVQERGYVNLRCKTDVGCPREIILDRSPPDETKHAEHAYPDVYGQFFNLSVQEVKEKVPVIASPCCAQFAVSAAEVLKRPRSEYERYLNLIETLEYDDETLGTVLEYMWHIIFGQDAVHCPNVDECYASVYGREDVPFG